MLLSSTLFNDFTDTNMFVLHVVKQPIRPNTLYYKIESRHSTFRYIIFVSINDEFDNETKQLKF